MQGKIFVITRESTMEIQWKYIGNTLEIHRKYIGNTLEIHWQYIGNTSIQMQFLFSIAFPIS